MYVKKTIISGAVLEVEKTFTIRYKGKHTVRGPRKETTPEAMAKVNERNAKKNLARLLNCNFKKGDLYLTLTYKIDNRAASAEDCKNDLAKFLRNVKLASKRRGLEFYYVAVSTFGERSMHHHVVMRCGLTMDELTKIWRLGWINFKPLDGSGDYTQLADYLIKHTNKTFNDSAKRVHAKRYIHSRNMKKPIVKTEVVGAESWRENVKAPKGYYLIKDSVVSDVSDLTGFPYQYYKCMSLNIQH